MPATVTIQELLPRLEQIRDEIEISANTATRVGQCLIDMLSLITEGSYVTLNSVQIITAEKIFNGLVVFGDTIGGYDAEDGDTGSTFWEIHADGSGFFNGDLEFHGLLHGRRTGTTSEQRYVWFIDESGIASFNRLNITDNAGNINITLFPNGNAFFSGTVTATTFNGDLNGTAANAEKLGGKTYGQLMSEIDDVYVSKAWLREVFRVWGGHGEEIIGNSTDDFDHGEVSDIQFMFGVWTNRFVSALGKNPSGSSGGGSATTLRELLDTDIPNTIPTGRVLGWNGNYWVPVEALNTTALANYLSQNGYVKRSEINSILNNFYTKAQIDAMFARLDSTYVRIDWFTKIFKVFTSADIEIAPNASGVADNIRAMVGLWTQQYLSALGLNADAASGGGASTLADLLDTEIVNPRAGQVLGWNGNFWVPTTALDQTALATYLATHGYITDHTIDDILADYLTASQVQQYAALNYYSKSQVNGFKWWGQQLANGVVTGAMTGVTSIDSLMYFSNGKVGIGTSSPLTSLHLATGYNLTVGSNIYLHRYLFMNFGGEGLYFLNGGIYTHNSGQHVASVAIFSQAGSSTFYHEMNVNGLLTANGNIKTASYIDIGPVRIQYDSDNAQLKVVNVDGTAGSLYATGGISALGSSSLNPGGSGADLATMWASLRNDTTVSNWSDISPFRNYKIALAHLPSEVALQSQLEDLLSAYLTKSDAAATYLTKNQAASTYLTASEAAYTYLKKTDAAATYLTINDAYSTYLSMTDAAAIYLRKTEAASTYLTMSDAAETYLTIFVAAQTYVTLNTQQTITGKKTFSQPIVGNLAGTADNALTLEGHGAGYFVDRYNAQSVGGEKTFTAATTIQNTLYVSQRVGIGVSPDSAHSLITSGSILSEGSLHGTISVITDGDFRLRTESKSVRIRYDEESNTIWFDGGTPSAPVNIATTGGVSALGLSEADGEIPELTVNKLIAGDSDLFPAYDTPGVSQDGQRILTAYGPVALRNSLWLWGNLHLASETTGNDAHFFTRGKEVYVWFGYGTTHSTEPVYKLVKTEVQL